MEEQLQILESTKKTTDTGYGKCTSVDENTLLQWKVKAKNLIETVCGIASTYAQDFFKAEQTRLIYGNVNQFNAIKSVFIATKEDYEKGYLNNSFKKKDNKDPVLTENIKEKPSQSSNKSKVFIVHGRDDLAKTETARFKWSFS
jgi:hypothetical protein